MPKRTTILYTSSDAPRGGNAESERLLVYHCKYSGRHAFTTDVDIDTLPRRRTDGARVLDTSQHTIRLHTTDGGTKLLRREDGRVERQHRLNVGALPVAYTSDPLPGHEEGQLVYIMDRAVTCYLGGGGDRAPLPPCIRVGESGNVEVTLELEDRQPHAAVGKITAEAVHVRLTGNAAHDGGAQQELVALMAKTLGLRPTHLTLLRGHEGGGPRSRVLVVEALSARAVYARLRGLPLPQRKEQQGQGAGGQKRQKPWHAGL